MEDRTLQELDAAAAREAAACWVSPEWALAWMRLSHLGGVSKGEEQSLLKRDGPAREIAQRYRAAVFNLGPDTCDFSVVGDTDKWA